MENFIDLKNRIKKNEGFRNKPYSDSLGNLTIGYGHLIRKKKQFLLNKKYSKKFLLNLFDLDFKKALLGYLKNYKNSKHSKEIKDMYIEMIFQMGIKNNKKFFKMNYFINRKQLFMAALEMKNSLWFQQTPKRVDGLIKTLLKKEYERKR